MSEEIKGQLVNLLELSFCQVKESIERDDFKSYSVNLSQLNILFSKVNATLFKESPNHLQQKDVKLMGGKENLRVLYLF